MTAENEKDTDDKRPSRIRRVREFVVADTVRGSRPGGDKRTVAKAGERETR